MSNKKSQKKAAKPVNSNAGEKTTEKKGINKSTRNILIAAAAVVVVAAAVLIGVFAVSLTENFFIVFVEFRIFVHNITLVHIN